MNKSGGGEIENLFVSNPGLWRGSVPKLLLKRLQASLTNGTKERPHSISNKKPWGKNRGSLSSPGTWLLGTQLPGLLGFPHGEEQAPGEQVELREEKGAKSESSPFTGLPFRRYFSCPRHVWHPPSHHHSSTVKKHLPGFRYVHSSLVAFLLTYV